jgi:hypothetical protein
MEEWKMNKKLNALLTDGKVWIDNSMVEKFEQELNNRGISFFSFTSGNETMVELDIPEEEN